jgi:hypothetical protein
MILQHGSARGEAIAWAPRRAAKQRLTLLPHPFAAGAGRSCPGGDPGDVGGVVGPPGADRE